MKNEFICECDQCGEWFRKKDCLFCEEKPLGPRYYCKDCQKSWESAYDGYDNNLVQY